MTHTRLLKVKTFNKTPVPCPCRKDFAAEAYFYGYTHRILPTKKGGLIRGFLIEV
jgi:hypothetical protein